MAGIQFVAVHLRCQRFVAAHRIAYPARGHYLSLHRSEIINHRDADRGSKLRVVFDAADLRCGSEDVVGDPEADGPPVRLQFVDAENVGATYREQAADKFAVVGSRLAECGRREGDEQRDN